jgi:hypothetical protein
MTDRRIVTSRVDMCGFTIWQAWDDRLGADTSPIGDGPTKEDAIEDLLWQLDEMEAAQ